MKTNFPGDLAAEIDAAMVEVGPDYLTHQFEGVREGLAALAAP